MNQNRTRWIVPITAYVNPQMLPQRIGLLVFLAAMPLDVLNGHGKGFLADADHFQGWEVAYLGFLFSSWLFDGDWTFIVFLPTAVTTAFTLTMPFVDLSNPGVGTTIARVLKTVGVASCLLTMLWMLNWASSEGAFWGIVPWLGGAALVVFGCFASGLKQTLCGVCGHFHCERCSL